MLYDNDLLKCFWVEAISTANYVLNKCLIRDILKKTYCHLLKGKKPRGFYFRAFSCKCFICKHGNKNLRKLDPRSDKGICVGYSQQRRAYRVYKKGTKVVKESIYVVFNKNNDGTLSSRSFKQLQLSRYDNDEEQIVNYNKVTAHSSIS